MEGAAAAPSVPCNELSIAVVRPPSRPIEKVARRLLCHLDGALFPFDQVRSLQPRENSEKEGGGFLLEFYRPIPSVLTVFLHCGTRYNVKHNDMSDRVSG